MSPLRRVAVPLRLAAVRARSASGATALAALGIAAAAAMIAAVLGASLVARDRSLARALDEVPSAGRCSTGTRATPSRRSAIPTKRPATVLWR